VVIADDQALFREGLRAVLTAHGAEVVGEARTGAEAVDLAARLRPDVVLMDLRMPVLDGAAATRRIQAAALPPRVIVLTTFDDDDSVFDAVRAGALGYLLKDTSSSKLLEANDLGRDHRPMARDPPYGLLAAMTVTSFDRTAAWLGRRAWNALHTVGSLTLWGAFLVRVRHAPGYWLAVALAGVAMALRIIAWARRRGRRGLSTTAGGAR
jgi:CheY-like chemotaxis protein